MADGVQTILARGSIAKVGQAIVAGDAIVMADLHARRAWSDKRGHHEHVDAEMRYSVVGAELDEHVPRMGVRMRPPHHSFAELLAPVEVVDHSIHAADSTEVRDLVARIAGDSQPLLIGH